MGEEARLEGLLDGLNEEQRLAVTSEAAPLCILAGAGSGKTRVLTRRIAYRAAAGTLDPRRALVLTFTRAAAGELSERLRRLGLRDRPTAGTFHAVAYGQMRRRWAERRATPPTLLTAKSRLVARHLPRGAGARVGEVVTEIEWAKARVIGPAAYASAASAARRDPAGGVEAVAAAYEAYEAAKRKGNLVDFDDLLWLAIHHLERDVDGAAATRWAHQHLFVDEYQDVNPLQFRLLQAWLGPRHDLCVVGDPNQAIYAWNGADPTLIERFGDHFPGAEVLMLPRNHRSTPQVLALANRVLDAGALTGVRLVATLPEGPEPVITAAPDAASEIEAVVAAVRGHHDRNVPWRHQAVLVRANSQVAPVADALRAAGVPVRVRQQAALVDQPAVKQALTVLRRRGMVEGLAVLDRGADPHEGAAGDDEDAVAVAELVRLAGEYTATDPSPTAAGFEGWLAASAADDDPGIAAVMVGTFHAAKGLEWPVVHLAGLEDGVVPHVRARTPEALAEERRLFYVAITRAGRVVHLSWARSRTFGEREVRRRPSPYLADLEPVLAVMASAASRVDSGRLATSAVGVVRAVRPRAEPASPIADRLRAWRATKARATGLPPAAVLDDDALVALSLTQPTDTAGLAAIVGVIRAPRLADELLPLLSAEGA